MGVSVKNKFCTNELIRFANIVPAQYILCMYESLQVMERAWLSVCQVMVKLLKEPYLISRRYKLI